MLKTLDYGVEEKKARTENVAKLLAELDTSATSVKILNFADKFDLDPLDVKEKIKSDSMFALNFIKDPLKQSLHEDLAAKHIENELPLVRGFQQLPTRGENALYVQDGEIVSGADLEGEFKGKSLDFTWHYACEGHRLDVYAMHKHTKAEGGSQDNQYTDLKLFLEAASSNTNKDNLFIAICDGPYYQRTVNSSTRIDTLNTHFAGEQGVACSIDQLPTVWHQSLNNWKTHHDIEIDDADTVEYLILDEHASETP